MPTPTPTESGFRYERKFHARGLSRGQVELLVKLHRAHFCVAYPSRDVNNIYFDTRGLERFNTHVEGAAERRKLRIRWYGRAHGVVVHPVLEVKEKRGDVGTKQRFPLEPFEFDGSVELEALRRSIEQSVTDPTVVAAMVSSVPSLMNRYRRAYYRTADGHFRLTVDTDMSYRTVNGWRHAFRDRYADPLLTILELKYDVSQSEEAFRITEKLPFRVSKYSKYVYGIGCLGAGRF